MALAMALSLLIGHGTGWARESLHATEQPKATWSADNGNGTYSNPLFYDEFSDPDVIRVGEYVYLTGTTMHTMPGLPLLRSKDLVNWEFVSYAVNRLDLGPEYRLEDGKDIYGKGIWAPCLRFHKGIFYIFSNVNGKTTQVFSATNPEGPWTQHSMDKSFHDLSVLFDDDGKAYIVWGYQTLHLAQLNDTLTDIVPNTEHIIFSKDSGMGEGSHFYKFKGKYFILSANYAGGMRMSAARSDTVFGPYEVNPAISTNEDFGLSAGHRLNLPNPFALTGPPFTLSPPNPDVVNSLSLHQGAIVETPLGEWWGLSMMDANSIGRLTNLSPITWQDGWPYFGLKGNLTRTPRIWVKPKTSSVQPIKVPYERSDDFSGPLLKPIWQWNHVPVDRLWSLSERPGYLRLHTLPANSFWEAKNTLTQRAIGPVSSPIVALDVSHLQDGDVAGLGLLDRPYAWLGVEKSDKGLSITYYDQTKDTRISVNTEVTKLYLRADCDFMSEQAQFSYSTDNIHFIPMGKPFTMVFQLITFQGVRYSLFAYNQLGKNGGYADFDSIDVREAKPHGLMRAIPYGKSIGLTSFLSPTGLAINGRHVVSAKAQPFKVLDLGLGRVALSHGKALVSIAKNGQAALVYGQPGLAESFQWMETPTGELILMSLQTNRFLRIDPKSHQVIADSPGPLPNGSDGDRFIWQVIGS